MKTLKLTDRQGNRADYELCLPDSMDQWSVHGLLEFLSKPLAESRRDGFLVDAPDRLRHETLRRLVEHNASTFQRPVQFVQNNTLLDLFDSIDTTEPQTEILLERDETTSRGNPAALSLTDCNRRAFCGCGGEIIRIIDKLFRFTAYEIRDRKNARIESFAELIDGFSENVDATNQLRVLFRLADIVYARPFENISKLTSGVPFCSGWEMWGRMDQGGGGICAEKTSALKFICDVLGVETFYVAGSQHAIPDDFEAQLKQYVRAEGDAPQPVWIQHLLLGFNLDGNEYLTDVSNGNLPLLFLSEVDLPRYLNAGYRARMVYGVEFLNLKKISSWAGDALLTLSEFHVPNLHFQYIFDQALGLHVSANAHLGAFFDYGKEQSARYQAHYTALADELHLPCPRFIHEGNLQSVPDEALQKTLRDVLDALRDRYENPHYTGDFTFVLQPLTGDRWQQPRISADIRSTVLPEEIS